ncbi:uncharacterized protein LOC107798969 [Nicotiana tabacum]|uniref:Uncharacterized protein LOC107798969 n=1 Tax=Nicotiana tabacum TaxID=4097 RepID=A0A1S4AL92_TOBAC|nr:PREDICTED: uncharacterized protein LOC107798969 [Nicotiana tabacum]
MLNYHKSSIVALLETHMQDHAYLKDEFGFSNLAQSPAQGISGGIALLWKEKDIKLEQVAVTNQEIHSIVQVHPNTSTWLLSIVYAKNDLHARSILWDNLRSIYDQIKLPWLIGGDFNEITASNEKYGGLSINNNRTDHFIKCINYCNLVDLGYTGSKYTWSNNQRLANRILE